MPIHIVHVEDDLPLRDIIKVAFQAVEPQIELHQFDDAEQAIPYIMQYGQTVDLFLLDVFLPSAMNGVALAEKIRDLKCPGHIVLTSAYISPKHEVLEDLHSEYYQKPWDIITMSQRLVKYRLGHSTGQLF